MYTFGSSGGEVTIFLRYMDEQLVIYPSILYFQIVLIKVRGAAGVYLSSGDGGTHPEQVSILLQGFAHRQTFPLIHMREGESPIKCIEHVSGTREEAKTLGEKAHGEHANSTWKGPSGRNHLFQFLIIS